MRTLRAEVDATRRDERVERDENGDELVVVRDVYDVSLWDGDARYLRTVELVEGADLDALRAAIQAEADAIREALVAEEQAVPAPDPTPFAVEPGADLGAL